MKTLLYTLLALLLVSCTTTPKQVDSNIYSLNTQVVLDGAVETNLSKIATNARIVQLETTDDCLIGKSPAMYLVDSLIIVTSSNKGAVYVFDSETGRFKYEISGHNDKDAKGYVGSPLPLVVNEDKKEIYLSKDGSMVVRDYLTGGYKRQLPIKNHLYYMYHIVNDTSLLTFMYYRHDDKDCSTVNLIKQDSGSKIKEFGLFSSDDFIGAVSSRGRHIYNYKDTLGVVFYKNDTIFGVDKSTLSLHPRYKLNEGGYLPPEDINKRLFSTLKEGMSSGSIMDNYMFITGVSESERYLFMEISYLHDKKSNTLNLYFDS